MLERECGVERPGVIQLQGKTQWWGEVFRMAREYGVDLVELEHRISENSWNEYVKKCLAKSVEERWHKEVVERTSLGLPKMQNWRRPVQTHFKFKLSMIK